MAQRHGGAQHAFAAHQSDFERHAPFGHAQQGDQAIVWKINKVDQVAGVGQYAAHLDVDVFEHGHHARQFVGRQGSQHLVGGMRREDRRRGEIHPILAGRGNVCVHENIRLSGMVWGRRYICQQFETA